MNHELERILLVNLCWRKFAADRSRRRRRTADKNTDPRLFVLWIGVRKKWIRPQCRTPPNARPTGQDRAPAARPSAYGRGAADTNNRDV